MTEAYDGRQVVGMDLHRRRSVLVRMTEDGRKLETVRIENSPAALRAVIARAGNNPRVVVEHLVQGPGARGAGQVRDPRHPFRDLRAGRRDLAGRAAAAAAVRRQGRLAAGADQRA
jgi:hypothetical protein